LLAHSSAWHRVPGYSKRVFRHGINGGLETHRRVRASKRRFFSGMVLRLDIHIAAARQANHIRI
jgi:hypothetical protein